MKQHQPILDGTTVRAGCFLLLSVLSAWFLTACQGAPEKQVRQLPAKKTASTSAPSPVPTASPTFALSFTALQQEAEHHPQALAETLVTLGGVNRLRGLMLESNGEVIVLGDHDPASPLLHLDDVAVVLRNAFQTEAEYASAPLGVSIDPWPSAGQDPWAIQQTKVFGMPRTTHMAQRQVAIDYDLKKVSAGIMVLSGDITGTYDLMRSASPVCRGASTQQTETTHRFWFCARYPDAAPRFTEEEGIILIVNPVGVHLLTEREFFDQSGHRSGAIQAAPQAELFAQLVSQLFMAPQPPQDYRHLLSDFRLIELAQVLKFKNVDPHGLHYLLHEHRLAAVAVPEYVGGVRRREEGEVTCATQISERPTPQGRAIESQEQVQRYRLTYRGGVEATVAVAPEHIQAEAPGSFAELRHRVRDSRPSATAWVWKIR